MAVEYFEGFETIGTDTGLAYESDIADRLDLRMTNTGSGVAPATTGFFLIDDYLAEGYAVCMGTASGSVNCVLDLPVPEAIQTGPAGPTTPTVAVGMLLHVPSVTTRTAAFFQVRNQFAVSGWDNNFNVAYKDGTDLYITFGSGISLRYTTVSNAITPGAWQYIEFKFKCADLADGGFLTIKVNGDIVSDQNPIDMNNGATLEPYNRFRLQGAAASTASEDFTAFDDIYIIDCDNTPAPQDCTGAVRIRTLPPMIDHQREWSNNDGSFDNFDKIDENGADDTDYVQTDGDGYTDIYGMTNTDTDYPDPVYAVKVEAEAINATGGTPELTFQLISGVSTVEEAVVVDDTANYSVVSIFSAVDPATSAAWTVAGVDALKLGLKMEDGY